MPEEEINRKLTAIMFTDIAGYSRMMEANETETMNFLNFHNTLINLEILKYSGRVIKTLGDSFMADFSSVVNAVQCAVSIQKHFLDHNRATGETRQIRIGIHIGDVVVKENDLFGDGVNIAARIEPLAEPGGICVSGDVYHHIKNKGGYKFASLGFKELKNIGHKVEIFKIVMEGLGKPKLTWTKVIGAFFLFLALVGVLIGAYFSGKGGLPPEIKGLLNLPETPSPLPTIIPTAVLSTPTAQPTATPFPLSPTFTFTPVPEPTPIPTRKPQPKKVPQKRKPKSGHKKVVVDPNEVVSDEPESDESGAAKGSENEVVTDEPETGDDISKLKGEGSSGSKVPSGAGTDTAIPSSPNTDPLQPRTDDLPALPGRVNPKATP